MSHAVTDLPRRHRLSVDDYRRMAEVGIFAPDDRVELIDGEIIDMVPPGDSHIVTVMLLDRALRVAEKDAFVLVQSPVRLSQFSQPQPDVALLRLRDDSYRGHRLEAADVLLVVEVADSSLRFDRDTKMRLYAAHGIAEAWLVDVRGQRLIRHRAPQDGAYTLVDKPNLGAVLDVSALPGVTIDLRKLFG
jgi:Uma2 family endonuclease